MCCSVVRIAGTSLNDAFGPGNQARCHCHVKLCTLWCPLFRRHFCTYVPIMARTCCTAKKGYCCSVSPSSTCCPKGHNQKHVTEHVEALMTWHMPVAAAPHNCMRLHCGLIPPPSLKPTCTTTSNMHNNNIEHCVQTLPHKCHVMWRSTPTTADQM